MRTMLKFQISVEAGNDAIRSGRIAAINEELMARLQPEAAYFSTEHGTRTSYIVFDLQEPSQIPSISEPLFQNYNAIVEFFPVMDAADLQKAIAALAPAEGATQAS